MKVLNYLHKFTIVKSECQGWNYSWIWLQSIALSFYASHTMVPQVGGRWRSLQLLRTNATQDFPCLCAVQDNVLSVDCYIKSSKILIVFARVAQRRNKKQTASGVRHDRFDLLYLPREDKRKKLQISFWEENTVWIVFSFPCRFPFLSAVNCVRQWTREMSPISVTQTGSKKKQKKNPIQ